MTEERQGQIAVMLIKQRLKKMGIPGGLDREMGNIRKELGLSKHEIQSFYEAILPEVLGDILGRKRVSLTTGD